MPPSKISVTETKCTLDKLEKTIGLLKRVGGKRNWYINNDSTISIHIAYSQFLRKQNWYWYGLSAKDIKKAMGFPHSFVVFIADTCKDVLVVPVREIWPKLKESSTDQNGNYKMHVFSNWRFEANGSVELRSFHNKYSQLSRAGNQKGLSSKPVKNIQRKKTK